jgi:RWD domain
MSEENETDNIARQQAELALIEAIYPSEFLSVSTDVAKVLSPPSKPLADGK